MGAYVQSVLQAVEKYQTQDSEDCSSSIKLGAKRRNLPWELTEEQFRTLTISPCYYTGREPSNVFTSSNAL